MCRTLVRVWALHTISEAPVVARAAAQAGRATDWTDLQFGVPVRVVAALLGLAGDLPDEAARLIGEFVRCVPASATATDQAAAGPPPPPGGAPPAPPPPARGRGAGRARG
ncbi:hypothetical protein ACFW1M_27215, partial [Streptomyces inhibens]|uniref:hypothetical protein n=1 Tax=Streptomyces inhibens TaxID=2293571 RepID=UPI003685024D